MENVEYVRKDKTAYAVATAIVSVVIGFIPASVVVVIYTYFLNFFLAPLDYPSFLPSFALLEWLSWIPALLNRLALSWFPELLRGIIAGAVAIGISRYFFKQSNIETVRYGTLMFWTGITILLLLTWYFKHGLTLELVGIAAFQIGMAFGLHAAD